MPVLSDPTRLRAYDRGVIRRSRALTAVVLALVAVFTVGIPILVTVLNGDATYSVLYKGYPGVLTSLTATVLRSVADLAAWVTAGCLVVLLFLVAKPGANRTVVDTEPEWRILRISSLVWMLTAAALIPVDAADANGLALTRLAEPGAIPFLVEAAYLPKAWIVVFVLALITFATSAFAIGWTGLLIGAWCTGIALLAPVVVGQVQVGVNHDFGSDAATVQTVAAAVLFGTVWALACRTATGRLLRPDTLRRAGRLLAVAWIAIALPEILLVWFKLAGPRAGSNPTWIMLAVQSGAILATGGILLALWLRRARSTDRGIVRALAWLGLLGAIFLGTTVAMTRVPPPNYFADSSIMEAFLGFDVNEAPSPIVLLTAWRPNVLLLVISAVGVAVYLAAVIRLRRRGDRWPGGRTAAWLLGWAVVVVSTSSGLGKYSAADFGIHMIVHMSLNMLAPVLLVMGGVVTLLLRATTPHPQGQPTGPHEWILAVLHSPFLRFLYNPIVVFMLYIGSYYGLYLTGLFEQVIKFHWAHQAMNLHFLIVGYLFYSLIIGVDRPPRPLPPIGKLGFVLAAMPFHAFFGIILMTASVPIADNFYRTLATPWMGDLLASQYLGGGIAWAGGELPLIVVMIALGVQWARQDQREAKRKDRHLDSGLDDEFDAYNRMLAELARRSEQHTLRPAAPGDDRDDPPPIGDGEPVDAEKTNR